MLKELSEKIRMLAMDTFRGGCYGVANVDAQAAFP